MKKRLRLGVLAIACFIIVLLLILFSTGFFNRELPQRCVGEGCISLSDISISEQRIIIEGSSVDLKEILIEKNRGVGLTVLNNDGKIHVVLQLFKNPESNEYNVLKEFVVKPNEEIKIIGLLNPSKSISSNVLFSIDPATKATLMASHYSEYLISCTTCTGESSQVRIVLE